MAVLARKLERQGIHIKTYPQLSDDPARDEKLRALSWQLEQDVPYGEPPTELDLEAFRRERLAPAPVLEDAFYVAVSGGRYLGMSSLWDYGAYLETEFTGVLPEYRGRGVAALMKLLGVRYAQRRGVAEVRTTNDAGNDAMRRLNEQLGFVAQPALLRLEKQLTYSSLHKH